eukprot:11414176-Alexandrium_andersonii.AAC.1
MLHGSMHLASTGCNAMSARRSFCSTLEAHVYRPARTRACARARMAGRHSNTGQYAAYTTEWTDKDT